jgi:hypothetical protein
MDEIVIVPAGFKETKRRAEGVFANDVEREEVSCYILALQGRSSGRILHTPPAKVEGFILRGITVDDLSKAKNTRIHILFKLL